MLLFEQAILLVFPQKMLDFGVKQWYSTSGARELDQQSGGHESSFTSIQMPGAVSMWASHIDSLSY